MLRGYSLPTRGAHLRLPYGSKTTEMVLTMITRVLDESHTAYVEQPKRPEISSGAGGDKGHQKKEEEKSVGDGSVGDYEQPKGEPQPEEPQGNVESPEKDTSQDSSAGPTKHVYTTATIIFVPVPVPSSKPGHNVTVPSHDDNHVHPAANEEENVPGIEANGAARTGATAMVMLFVVVAVIAI
ncbi:hypothetical protein ACHAQH_000454 [Verticillium albo-atrum]